MDFRETEGDPLALPPALESFFFAVFSMTGVARARALNASRAFNSDASIARLLFGRRELANIREEQSAHARRDKITYLGKTLRSKHFYQIQEVTPVPT